MRAATTNARARSTLRRANGAPRTQAEFLDHTLLGISDAHVDALFEEWNFDSQLTALERADVVIQKAWDAPSMGEAAELAIVALALCLDCSDAYTLLAQVLPGGLDEQRTMLHRGVEAGRRALGADFFDDEAGNFWLILETRPFMRCLFELALCEWAMGHHDEAIEHSRELLQLNPNDNQGIRHLLAAWLLELDRPDELRRLLDAYEDDPFAGWPYAYALLAFQREGDTPASRALLAQALQANPHVPAYLLDEKAAPPDPSDPPDTIALGGEDEALAVGLQYASSWKRIPGARAWLQEFQGPDERRTAEKPR